MWLTGGAARGVLVVLLLGGACLAVPIDAAASDVCPTVMPAIALPDPSAAVEIDSGEPYAAIADRLALLASMMGDGSQVTGIRQIPESLPVDAAVAWVWQFGYVVDLRYPGDQIEQIPPRFEAILCLGTRVPESVGESVATTVTALESRALTPASRLDAQWSVVALEPGPGELVQFGSSVEIVAEPVIVPPSERPTRSPSTVPPSERPTRSPSTVPPSERPTRSPSTAPPSEAADGDGEVGDSAPLWPWLILAVAGAAAVATVATRHRSRARTRTRARDPQVTTRVHEDPPRTEVTEPPGLGRAHTVRIQTHHDSPDVTIAPAGPADGPATGDPHGTQGR